MALSGIIPGVREVFLAGSRSRGTQLHSHHDTDLFVVLHEQSRGRLYRRGPDECLRALQSAVAPACADGVRVRLQNRSLGLLAPEGRGDCDLVFAFRHPWRRGIYFIPDRALDRWILSSPGAQRRANHDAGHRTGGAINPLIRAVKQWNLCHGKPLKSFHLEAMVYRAFEAPPRDGRSALIALFDHLMRAIERPCPDPGGVGLSVDEHVTDTLRSRARRLLAEARSSLEAECLPWNCETNWRLS